MWTVIEYDHGECGEWLFKSKEDAERFASKRTRELDPADYWTSYIVEYVDEYRDEDLECLDYYPEDRCWY